MRIKFLKTICFLCVCLSVVFIFYAGCYAHSGDTDSNGGHHDTITGYYHYHCDGRPAHEHVNGVCPYKDLPSYPKPSGSSYENSKPATTAQKTNTPSDESDDDFDWWALAIIGGVIALYIWIEKGNRRW